MNMPQLNYELDQGVVVRYNNPPFLTRSHQIMGTLSIKFLEKYLLGFLLIQLSYDFVNFSFSLDSCFDCLVEIDFL